MSAPIKSPNVIIHPESQDLLDTYLGNVEKILVNANLSELEVDNLIVDVFHSILDLSTKYLPPQGPYYVTRPILQKVLEELGDPEDVAQTFLEEYRSVSDAVAGGNAPNAGATMQRLHSRRQSSSSMPSRSTVPVTTTVRSLLISPWVGTVTLGFQSLIALFMTLMIIVLNWDAFSSSYPPSFDIDKATVEPMTWLVLVANVLYIMFSFLSFHSMRRRVVQGDPLTPRDAPVIKKYSDKVMFFSSAVFFWYLLSFGSMIWSNGYLEIIIGKMMAFLLGGIILSGYWMARVLDWERPIESWERFKSFKDASIVDFLEAFSLKNDVGAIAESMSGYHRKEEKLGSWHLLARGIQVTIVVFMVWVPLLFMLFSNINSWATTDFWINYMGTLFLAFIILDLIIRFELLQGKISVHAVLSSSIEQWMHVVNCIVGSVGFIYVTLLTGSPLAAFIIIGAEILWLEQVYQQLSKDRQLPRETRHNLVSDTEAVITPSRSRASSAASQSIVQEDASSERVVTFTPSSPQASSSSANQSTSTWSISSFDSPLAPMLDFVGSVIKSVSLAIFYTASLIIVLTAAVYSILVMWLFDPSQFFIFEENILLNDPIAKMMPVSPTVVFFTSLALQFVFLVMTIYHRVRKRPLSLSFRIITYFMLLLVVVPLAMISYVVYMVWTYNVGIYLRVPLWDFFMFLVGSLVLNFMMIVEKRQVSKSLTRQASTSPARSSIH